MKNMKNMKKIVSGMLLFALLPISSLANATGGTINFNYSNYNGDQKLQVSGAIDAQIDQKLSKITDYYSQFKLLKDLATQTLTKKNATKSTKDKNKYAELINYYSAKADLLYQISDLTNKDDITKLKNTFKIAIKSKDTTLNKVISKVNSVGKVEITNDNNNFNELSSSDFAKETQKMIDDTKINPYYSFDEIKEQSKNINLDNFKKVKSILPQNISYTDEFGIDIKGELKLNTGLLGDGKANANEKLISIVKEKLSKFQNLSKENIDDYLLGASELYSILGDKTYVYNFLSKIEINGLSNINTDTKVTVKKIIDNNKKEKGYSITLNSKLPIIKLGKIFSYGGIDMYMFFDKKGEPIYYLYPNLKDYIYLGVDKNNIKQYMTIDFISKSIYLQTLSDKEYRSSGNGKIINKYTDAKFSSSSINVIFDDGTKINNTNTKYDLDTFKKIINKKITRINIDGEDMNSGLLLDKGSILNLYK